MKRTALFCLVILSLVGCQKKVDEVPKPEPPTVPVKINLTNPGFESPLSSGWTIETTYKGQYGFRQDTAAKLQGSYGLSFYAAQPNHYPGNPQETPWNGRIYQSLQNLKNGKYIFTVYGAAIGNGMYVYANGGKDDYKLAFRTDQVERYQLEFEVTNGTAKVGLLCIDAGGPQMYAPFFRVDELELWTK